MRKKEFHFNLELEELSHGNKIFYSYDNKGQLEQIVTRNFGEDKVYAWAKFHYSNTGNTKNIRIETSNEKELFYSLQNGVTLREIQKPTTPKETIEYTYFKDSWWGAVESFTFHEERKHSVTYYDSGTEYDIAGITIEVDDSFDPRIGRVRTLYQTLDSTETLPTHHFFYHIESKQEADFADPRYSVNGNTIYKNEFLAGVFDANLNKTTVQYSIDYRPNEIRYFNKDSLHHTVQNFWDSFGQLTKRILYDETSTPISTKCYEYDEKGNPLCEKLTGTICSLETSDTQIQSNMYDKKNRLVETISPSGLTVKISYLKDTNLPIKKTVFAGNILIEETFFYDEDNHLIEKRKESEGQTFSTRFTLKKSAPAQDFPEIVEEFANDTLLKKIVFHYNKEAQIIQEEIYDATEKLQYTIHRTYDEKGRLIEEVNPLGHLTSYSYNPYNEPITQQDPSGKTTTRTFDFAGRLTNEKERIPEGNERKTKRTLDNTGHLISEVDPFGNTTEYKRNRFGKILEIIHPDKTSEKYHYDTFGNTISYTDPCGNATQTIYNILGQPLLITHPDKTTEIFTYYLSGNLKTYTNQAGLTTEYQYDALDRKTDIIYYSAEGEKLADEHFTYNSLYLLAHRDKAGIEITYTYDFAGRKASEQRGDHLTSYLYDDMGRLYQEITGPLITSYTYDHLGQVIKVEKHTYVTTYAYDTNGNQTSITTPSGITKNSYDAFNRLVSFTIAEGNITTISYSEDGNLETINTDPAGYRTIETYDKRMHLNSKKVETPEHRLIAEEEYDLDPNGNTLTCRTHVFNQVTRTHIHEIQKTYDSCNRITSLREGKKVTKYTYTPSGKLACTIKPDQTTLSYFYDSFDNLIELTSSDGSIHNTFAYNLNHQIIQANGTTRSLDIHGNILQETQENGITLTYTYDLLNRKTSLTTPHTTITYTYDPLHLISVMALGQTITFTYNDAHLPATINNLEPATYEYDKMGRPIALSSPHFTQTLTYDCRGNVINMTKGLLSHVFTYDGLSQLLTEPNYTYAYESNYNRIAKNNVPYLIATDNNALEQAGSISFTYDENGNPLTIGDTRFTYDALDRLISVTSPTSHTIYSYDAFNRRMSKTSENTIHFLYDNETEIGTEDQLRIVAGPYTLLIQNSDMIYSCLQDLQGNMAITLSLDGRTAYSYCYNAFGEEHPIEDPNPWHYASKRLDPESNLIYFGKRYYDPVHGRWLTPDPVGYVDCTNLYTYTLNNPYTYTDPLGLFSLSTVDPPETLQYIDFEENAPGVYYSRYFNNHVYQMPVHLEQSSLFDLPDRPEIPNRRIIFVNGIKTNFNDANNHANYLSKISGGYNIHGVHSATFGVSVHLGGVTR